MYVQRRVDMAGFVIERATIGTEPMGEMGRVDDGLDLPVPKAPERQSGGAGPRRRRERKVTFWTTEEELARLRELSSDAGTSMSRYLLDSTVYADAVRCVPTRAELHQVIAELRREGNNVNQIARALNAGAAPIDDRSKEAMVRTIDELLATWKQVLAGVTVTMAELDGVLPS